MIDKDAYDSLITALSRVFKSFPDSLTETGNGKGHRSESDNPDPPKHTTITVMSIGKDKKESPAIPRIKPDKLNDRSIGSSKRGSKEE